MGLTFECIDSRLPSWVWRSLIQSTERPEWNQKSWVRMTSSCPTEWVGRRCFWSLWTQTKQQPFLDLEPANFGTRIYFTNSSGTQAFKLRLEIHICSPESSGWQLQILGLFSFPNHVKQFFVINLFLCKYIHPAGSFSVGKPNTPPRPSAFLCDHFLP